MLSVAASGNVWDQLDDVFHGLRICAPSSWSLPASDERERPRLGPPAENCHHVGSLIADHLLIAVPGFHFAAPLRDVRSLGREG